MGDSTAVDGDSSRQFDSTQLLRAYQQAIDQNIISSITDARGVIVHVNEKFCETSKYSRDELVGESHRIVNSGHHAKSFFTTMWQTIHRGQVWHGEIRNKTKDGNHYWVDTVIVPMRGEDANTHYFSLRTLITERKELERQRREHVGSLESLLVMTSQKVQRPLSACLEQLNLFDSAAPFDRGRQNEIMSALRLSAMELEGFTKHLSTYLRDMRV